MQKLSFIKGLTIGILFSAFFWFGAYQAVASFSEKEIPQDQNIEKSEVTEVRASF